VGDVPEVYFKLGIRLRELRKQRGLTQEELALQAGLNRAYVGFIERAERRPTIETVERLAGVLQTELHELFRF